MNSTEAKKQILLVELKKWWQQISDLQQEYRSNRFDLISRAQKYQSIFSKEAVGSDLFGFLVKEDQLWGQLNILLEEESFCLRKKFCELDFVEKKLVLAENE